MNRKHLLIVLALVVAPMAWSQVALELPSSYVNNSTSGGVNTLPPGVEGSPYLNEDFTVGTVYIENEQPYQAQMRYNAYQDEIQVKSTKGISSLFKRAYVWALIGGEMFKIEEYETRGQTTKGYFIELNEGQARLLKRIVHEFKEAEEATSSYSKGKPPRFDQEITYYLSIKGAPAKEVKLRKKDILAYLANNGDTENYAKKNKLKLKTEEEVIRLLGYYNSL